MFVWQNYQLYVFVCRGHSMQNVCLAGVLLALACYGLAWLWWLALPYPALPIEQSMLIKLTCNSALKCNTHAKTCREKDRNMGEDARISLRVLMNSFSFDLGELYRVYLNNYSIMNIFGHICIFLAFGSWGVK